MTSSEPVVYPTWSVIPKARDVFVKEEGGGGRGLNIVLARFFQKEVAGLIVDPAYGNPYEILGQSCRNRGSSSFMRLVLTRPRLRISEVMNSGALSRVKKDRIALILGEAVSLVACSIFRLWFGKTPSSSTPGFIELNYALNGYVDGILCQSADLTPESMSSLLRLLNARVTPLLNVDVILSQSLRLFQKEITEFADHIKTQIGAKECPLPLLQKIYEDSVRDLKTGGQEILDRLNRLSFVRTTGENQPLLQKISEVSTPSLTARGSGCRLQLILRRLQELEENPISLEKLNDVVGDLNSIVGDLNSYTEEALGVCRDHVRYSESTQWPIAFSNAY